MTYAVATSRIKLENGIELQELLLLGGVGEYFMEFARRGEAVGYVAGQLAVEREAILKIKPVSSEPRYGEACLTLHVEVRNPGEQIAEFLREHWNCNGSLMSHRGCYTCGCGAALEIEERAIL